jgi:amphi-Trp domain-containing protein
MGQEVVLFKSEEKQDRQSVVAFVRQLADKLESGEVTLIQGAESLTVSVPNTVTLEVKVEDETSSRGDVKHSLEVEIEWKDGDDAPGGVTLG